MDGSEVTIRIPKDPGSSGKFQAYYLATQLQGFSVWTEPESVSKEARADLLAAQCEQGNVKLLKAPWNDKFVEELCAFPNGAHDDQVDAATAAFRALLRHRRVIAVGA
jgi:predicted phage terminase large subunit-like protein